MAKVTLEAPTYFNTTGLIGAELRDSKNKASKQDGLVLEWMKARAGEKFTRDDISDQVLPNSPITSAGRALNTLMRHNKILKLDEMRQGKYKKPQHLWMCPVSVGQQELF
jgi:hypothetical protein